MKKKILYLFILLVSFQVRSQSVTINESGGSFESAYVKWQPISEANSYNVYYSGEGISSEKIDSQLIRCYNDGTYRADILGLKAGSYTISVVPVVNGVETTAAVSTPINVIPHDRAGFAFSGNRIAGAYNLDGTPQSGAVILYITEETKNTIELNVTGASTPTSTGLQDILDGFKKGKDTRPLIIRMIGQITDPSYLLNGDIVIENNQNMNSHITLEGVGDDAVADGWGIRVKNASNIEIRNIGTMNCNSGEGDNIGLQQSNDHIWVHNVDFFYGDAGGDADQAKGDGALDCKKSTYVTFSYNHFWDSGKSNLLGLSEGADPNLFITYHHNWYDHSDSRHPRVRYYSAHVYNNYYDGNSKYGIGSTLGSSVFSENNYFRNCKYPMLTSLQGTDIFYGYPTFSGEDGGAIKAYGNTIIGETRFVAYGDNNYTSSTTEFDAIVTSARNETIPNTITSKKGSNIYNNFDTNGSLDYTYTVDTAEEAKAKVMQYAGRLNGGDFTWTFNNSVDDTSSSVNTALKQALISYQTNLTCVQGISEPPSSQTLIITSDNKDQSVLDETAIEPIVFSWGGDATDVTITGIPASGIDFVKDNSAKTVTISGTPMADVSYTITTTGNAGTPVSKSGTISLITITSGDLIHNFTTSSKTSDFYTITGNINSTDGSVNYDGLTLTTRLKIESSTSITYTTAETSDLTLVFDATFTGKIKLDGIDYTASNGVVIITDIAAGSHSITKNNTTNLFYIKTTYKTLAFNNPKNLPKINLYPNPTSSILQIDTTLDIEEIQILNMLGSLVKKIKGDSKLIDISHLNSGSYLLCIKTNKGIYKQIVLRN
ncbi:T9SS type A sorting domain-containing protein [Wenyingzhuangia sp. chi5]|uniref:T9SS type A sorting domain-containing protein n=1 Tax=Wenyingzhuangia gilva TaxID=3057677 RepID=A0ABT8VQJ0_9FLAO|nr:T9SS type A sorting domain-containing protein [Wenyingzhuangia sp. chi5]MDO3694227.1 T9SS type A sorting domain-containing protein [Wenyingzhuangia sp. chi5]